MSSKPFGLFCPADPSHGTLIPLLSATKRGEGWYCPHQAHDGWHERPYVRPFYTTADAEAATAAARKAR